jgi:hypothetical protein
MENNPVNPVRPDAWINNVKQLTYKINSLKDEFSKVLNDWEDVRDEAGESGKAEIDAMFRKLSDAKNSLCTLKGGRRKNRRTRKHRR